MSLYDPALRYFLAVYETGSVNAAARSLYVAGSAVSRQMTRLERELGVQLFARLPGGVVPTDAGHAFAGYARRAIQDASDVADEIHQRRSVRPLIRIAATTGIAHDLVPKVAAEFRTGHPQARFVLRVEQPEEVTGLVRDGTVDLGVTFTLSLATGVAILYTREAPLRAVMRRDHPLSGRSVLSMKDLAAYPLALPPTTTTNRILVEACAAAHRVPLEPALVCPGPQGAIRFVRDTDAVTILGHVTVHHQDAVGDLVSVPLREQEFNQRALQIQHRAGMDPPPALAAFVDLLVAELDLVGV